MVILLCNNVEFPRGEDVQNVLQSGKNIDGIKILAPITRKQRARRVQNSAYNILVIYHLGYFRPMKPKWQQDSEWRTKKKKSSNILNRFIFWKLKRHFGCIRIFFAPFISDFCVFFFFLCFSRINEQKWIIWA